MNDTQRHVDRIVRQMQAIIHRAVRAKNLAEAKGQEMLAHRGIGELKPAETARQAALLAFEAHLDLMLEAGRLDHELLRLYE